MSDRLDPLLRFHPFTRLSELLAGIEPGGKPIVLSVGEPQQTPPAFIRPLIDRNLADWGRYPLATGTAEFRAATAGWLKRRYRLADGFVDADRHLLPAPGSRQALFMIALAAVPEAARGRRPTVLMPNPFYHVYAGAAAVAGAEPVFLPATAATGFLPDIDAIPKAALERAALAYVCSPANPQGAVADIGYLKRWIELGRKHGFTVAFDECYAEVYRRQPPAGALAAAQALGAGLENIACFHSLSKRSGAAGLRSGFTVGDERLMKRLQQLVNYGGVAVPLPILAASTALWEDERHVERNRAAYNENFALARRLLGNRCGWSEPAGGFFLWLDVGDGEAAARRLWAEAGLRVLPGAYMAQPGADGINPGAAYIRVALVHDLAVTADGLTRMARALDAMTAESTPRPAAKQAAGA